MKDNVRKAMEVAHEARYKMKIGAISYDEAKALIQPYITLVNEGAVRIAKEYGTSPRKVSVTGFLR